ncbi:MAG: hypothetical protein ACI39U_01735 [Candidatus Cryptobacteroides sp.]
MKRLLSPTVKGVIVEDSILSSFSDRLKQEISECMDFSNIPDCPNIEVHRNRKIYSIDCRSLRKGDACSWMVSLARTIEKENNPIVIIEHITELPDGDRSIFDDPYYVGNILVHAWKNEDIFLGDYHIDRRQCTIFLTCTPETEYKLNEVWNPSDSFAWIGKIEI